MNGLTADIFKDSNHSCDCTNNGVSNNFTRATIYGELVRDGNIDYDDLDTAKLYIHRNPRSMNLLMATPSPDPDDMFQFGGNFVFSSDSRFPSDQPIKIHDRVESRERRLQYKEIIVITDHYHRAWKFLNNEESTPGIEDLKGKLSTKISELGKKYQDVLNPKQRKRIFVGPEEKFDGFDAS